MSDEDIQAVSEYISGMAKSASLANQNA